VTGVMSNTELTDVISWGIRVADAWRPLVMRASRMKRVVTGVDTGIERPGFEPESAVPNDA
jgi:hypothetical protein